MKKDAVPSEVFQSFLLWVIAIGAGVFEMALAVIDSISSQTGSGIVGILTQVAARTMMFAVLVYIMIRMLRGKNWARITLALFLGGFGMLSLIIDPIKWLLTGGSLWDVFANADNISILFASSRILHVIAVVAALIFMFRPAANRYFKAEL
ncbi:hypothetical protein [Paenibacillus sp. MDMC362]|uniref:hypothetical protein n=1 Tax=Paenibacillus sp. MDMC362 TaxID=2977365 RepID=UPI000DC3061A|nr:hypothetical protein [Paenibacillus sp. MDMC362]RAR41493.1 hypothetical protein DP091_23380 [Paenibacillus sp. MDMC362]